MSKIMLSKIALYTLCMSIFMVSEVFAQRIDSVKYSVRPKPKVVSRFPQIKGAVQAYKLGSLNTAIAQSSNKSVKILTVLKVYPNPVTEQININLRLEKETTLSIKLTDLLGNDVITLANEKTAAGEHTKTFIIPTKLNSGIYFLRIVAGGEPVIKRISVL